MKLVFFSLVLSLIPTVFAQKVIGVNYETKSFLIVTDAESAVVLNNLLQAQLNELMMTMSRYRQSFSDNECRKGYPQDYRQCTLLNEAMRESAGNIATVGRQIIEVAKLLPTPEQSPLVNHRLWRIEENKSLK